MGVLSNIFKARDKPEYPGLGFDGLVGYSPIAMAKNAIGMAIACEEYGMIRSYSKTGYPYDNACIESFHALLKREWINRFKILDYNYTYRLVFEYIEAFYNTVRIHSHCDYM